MAKSSRFGRKTKIALAVLAIVLFLQFGVPLLRVAWECRVWATPTTPEAIPFTPAEIAAIPGYQRHESQSYFTFPEWYIVYSIEEYAAFIGDRPPSQFPYFQAVDQYWQSYYDVCAATRDKYTLSDFHIVLVIIGVSFTAENVSKGVYENTIGRLTEALSTPDLTEEDRYAYRLAKEYGAFMHTIPWYEYPFREKLMGLWSETSLWGPNPIRKWERKFSLSAEYATKMVYGGFLSWLTHTIYAPEDLEIRVLATGITDEVIAQTPEMKVIKKIDATTTAIVLPRYEPFTQILPGLAEHGVEFSVAAGNDDILISIFAPSEWAFDLSAGKVLFELPVLSNPTRKRVAINMPIKELMRVLTELDAHGVELEHIYDY